MKPRTKFQHRVIELSKALPDINDKMLAWTKTRCLEHKGYATKSRVVCMDCGQRFSPELVSRKRATCPHCHAKLNIEQTRCTIDKQMTYVTIAEVHGDFQVIRNYQVYAYYKAGGVPRYFFWEILQHFILPNGKYETVARLQNSVWNVDSWGGNMEIRKATYYKKYDVYPDTLHPDSIFREELSRCGIDRNLQGLTPLQAILNVPSDSKLETLLKAKQYELLSYMCGRSKILNEYWPSIKICLRNNYAIKDVGIWKDYLDLLSRYKKDLRNAHYVCPPNLKRAHDKYVARRSKDWATECEIRERDRAIREEQRKKQLIENIPENNAIYQQEKGKFFDLQFSDGTISVCVLKSIEEFREEGNEQEICVFTNEYYQKPESLILSARIEDKRVETVEVDLNRFCVIQCRGKHNGNTKYHDQIVQLVSKNMRAIQKRMSA